MKVIALPEGTFTVDKSKKFMPIGAGEKLQSRPPGSLLVQVQPFAVITSRDIILLDLGLGFSDEGKLQIHQNLLAAGIGPGEITKVLLSHLHKDHAGGVSEGTHHRRLSFPNATYYLQKREFDFAVKKGEPSFIPEEISVLKDSPNVRFLDDDSGTIDGYISYEMTGAHSPYHQVFWIRDEGETAFFGADDAPQLQQMKHRYVAKYDYDGRKAMELRRKWWEEGGRENWQFLFYHDAKAAVKTG